MDDKGRLFIAADLPENIKKDLSALAAGLRRSIPGNYSREINYHITLAFLGDTKLALTAKIREIILNAARGAAAFEVALSELGFFGRESNAVLWCGIKGAQPLYGIAEKIRDGLENAEVSFDPKPMKPHITLARKAKLDGVNLKQMHVPNTVGMLTGISLYLSYRVNGELTYSPITRPIVLGKH